MIAVDAAGHPAKLRQRSVFLVWGPPSHGPRTNVFARALGIDPVFLHVTRRRGLLIGPWKSDIHHPVPIRLQPTTGHLYDGVFIPMCLYLIVRCMHPGARDFRRVVPIIDLLRVNQAVIGVLQWAVVVDNHSNMRVAFGLGTWWLALGMIASLITRDHPVGWSFATREVPVLQPDGPAGRR